MITDTPAVNVTASTSTLPTPAIPNTDLPKDKHPESVSDLLSSLRDLEAQPAKSKPVRSTIHIYPVSIYAANHPSNEASTSTSALQDRRITSWKLNEFMFFKANNPLPTLARGLYTEEVVGEDGKKEERIVARGYDKFFNIDEVAWTNWDSMKHYTKAPYHITLKSNGCLILISALSPEHLIVTSKHTLGTTVEDQVDPEAAREHATANEEVHEELSTPIDDRNHSGSQQLDPGPSQKEEESGIEQKDEKKKRDTDSSGTLEPSKPHAEVGRDWLRRTLQKSGKSEAQLAERLWREKLTAVLELCDDNFEEHVIETPEHWTGLHLHGLNGNTPHFSTLPPDTVTEFANEFGFIPTKNFKVDTLEEVRKFTDEVAITGSWEGDAIEGFVVRSTVASTSEETEGKPPYRPGAPFFFKVKFEEPYLLYRTWRETTRSLLPLLEVNSPVKEAEILNGVIAKARRPEVGIYAEWCAEMMKKEPELFDNYQKKGILRVRNRFLAWTKGEGKDSWEAAKSQTWKAGKGRGSVKPKNDKSRLPKKWLLVPVAVPGCGKTLLGVALSKLFGFAHTQSDDITTKRTGPTFIRNITSLFKDNDVVYADRNNHLDTHYHGLAAIQRDKILQPYNLCEIAIIWDMTQHPFHRLLRICSERVVDRGDNHQTLRPDSTMEAEHEAVVAKFLHDFTEPDRETFTSVIDVKVEDDARMTLGRVVDALCGIEDMGLSRPDEAAIDQALEEARSYKVTTEYHSLSKVGKKVRYFGLAPEIDLREIMKTVLNPLSTSSSPLVKSAQSFFNALESTSRIAQKPHITLSHENNVEVEKQNLAVEGQSVPQGPHERLWNVCKALAETRFTPLYTFNMTHLVWDDRVMALVVDHIRPDAARLEGNGEKITKELEMPEEVRLNLHVTVGTKSEDIKAFESRGIIVAARKIMEGPNSGDAVIEGETEEVVEGGGKVRWLRIAPIQGQGRVKGMY